MVAAFAFAAAAAAAAAASGAGEGVRSGVASAAACAAAGAAAVVVAAAALFRVVEGKRGEKKVRDKRIREKDGRIAAVVDGMAARRKRARSLSRLFEREETQETPRTHSCSATAGVCTSPGERGTAAAAAGSIFFLKRGDDDFSTSQEKSERDEEKKSNSLLCFRWRRSVLLPLVAGSLRSQRQLLRFVPMQSKLCLRLAGGG